MSLLARFHPSALLLAWMALVVLGQGLSLSWLLPLLVMLCLLALCLDWLLSLRIFKRARYLLLTVLLLFAWGTPGATLWLTWPLLAPTWEGLALALEHGARLLWVLAWLVVLLHVTCAESLVAAIYGVLGVFKGLPREKVALRLLLVLRFAEQGRVNLRSWRDCLRWLESGDAQSLDKIAIRVAPFALRDVVLMLALLALLYGCL